ncbi:MAG: RNA 2',3'-cyclic phosphodiesterase [Gemmatimonadales bacterium]
MRLFIAIPLPEPARGETAEVLRALRQLDWPVRWIREDGPHLTLKFFGEVTSDRVDAIVEMLSFAAGGVSPIALSFSGATVFPTASRPRVVALAVDPEPSLELLQDRIERGAEKLGFPPEGRPFRPHVTLGRVREGHRLPASWETALERIRPGSAFLADRVVLFLSELGPSGPTYQVRNEVRFQ